MGQLSLLSPDYEFEHRKNEFYLTSKGRPRKRESRVEPELRNVFVEFGEDEPVYKDIQLVVGEGYSIMSNKKNGDFVLNVNGRQIEGIITDEIEIVKNILSWYDALSSSDRNLITTRMEGLMGKYRQISIISKDTNLAPSKTKCKHERKGHYRSISDGTSIYVRPTIVNKHIECDYEIEEELC